MTDSIAYILIAIIFFFFIAEFFGRSRHIGRWWSFALLLCGFIPGLIAILSSPSANKKPTSGGNSYKIGGYVCLFFSGLNLLALISTSGKLGQLFPVFLVSGIYLLLLSKGLIINNEPKYYLNILTKKNDSTLANNYKNNDELSIESLKQLKNKGILTDEEYRLKKQQIKKNSKNKALLNSPEYKQLKNLYENNILTKIEFEDKIELLKSDFNSINNKKTEVEKIDFLLNSSNNNSDRKILLYFIISFLAVLLIVLLVKYFSNSSENDSSNNFYNEPASYVDSTAVATSDDFEEKADTYSFDNKKFVFLKITAKTPELEVYQTPSYYDDFGFYKTYEPSFSVNYISKTFTTDILEVSTYNIDEEYRLKDKANNDVKYQLGTYDNIYSSDLLVKCKDYNRYKELQNEKSKIIETEIFTFNTYAEASQYKQNLKN